MIKFFHLYWRSRWERYYLKNRWHLLLDLGLVLALVILGISTVSLYLYRPVLNWPTVNVRPSINLDQPPLKVELIPENTTLRINESLGLNLKYWNNSVSPITQVKVRLVSQDKNYSLSLLEKNGVNPEAEIDGLEIIFPIIPSQAGGEVPLRLYFKDNNAVRREINWRLESEYFWGGQFFTASQDLPALRVAAELAVTSAAYYTSPQGDQLGLGPLPPTIGIPTNYWIFVEARGRGDFKNFVFSARLPQGVVLTENRSLLAGDFKYSSSTRQIIWKLAEVQDQEEKYRLGLEVQLTPSTGQLGRIPDLLIKSSYFAEDSATGLEISGTLEDLDANLSADRFNRGQGRVSE